MKSVVVLYAGTGLAGRTTNLGILYQIFHRNSYEAKLRSLRLPENDPSLDLIFVEAILPFENEDVCVRCGCWGCARYSPFKYSSEVKRSVLATVDGIVYVVDSQQDKIEWGKEDWGELIDVVSPQMPMVLQYNKRDMPTAVDLGILSSEFNASRSYLEYGSVAVKTFGVLETFLGILKQVVDTAVVGKLLGIGK